MKNLAVVLMLVMCSYMVMSCVENDKQDKSLTGSIAYEYGVKEVEGTLDGVPLSDYGEFLAGSWIDIIKNTTPSIDLVCGLFYGETIFLINIKIIEVSGKPYDVTLFHESAHGLVRIYENGWDKYTGYQNVNTRVTGWMKESTGLLDTRTSPRQPYYDCDIEIKCTIDGKELELRITKLE